MTPELVLELVRVLCLLGGAAVSAVVSVVGFVVSHKAKSDSDAFGGAFIGVIAMVGSCAFAVLFVCISLKDGGAVHQLLRMCFS